LEVSPKILQTKSLLELGIAKSFHKVRLKNLNLLSEFDMECDQIFPAEANSVSPTDSLSSDQRNTDTENLLNDLKRLEKSILDFNEQRKRTLAILHKRLEKEKARPLKPKTSDPKPTVDHLRPLQDEIEGMKGKLKAIETTISQKKERLNQLNKEILRQRTGLSTFEQTSTALSEFKAIQEQHESLIEKIEHLRAEITELESVERELSEQTNSKEGKK
jgi:chromosome segregation ATPase